MKLPAVLYVATLFAASACRHSHAENDAGPPGLRVFLPLRQGSFGSAEERAAIFELSDRVHAALEPIDAGDIAGNEFGAGQCVMIVHTGDPMRVWQAMEPVIRATPFVRGGHAEIHGASFDRRVDF